MGSGYGNPASPDVRAVAIFDGHYSILKRRVVSEANDKENESWAAGWTLKQMI
jgi:hypothetical protein